MPSPKELAKALARQDSVTKQPRNRFFGAVADAAGYLSDQADRYVVPERDPLFGGMRGGDLLPLRNVNRLLDDLSYGGRITTGRGQTTALRPEVVDTVGLGGAMMPAAKSLGKAALREGARQIETGTGIGRAVVDPRSPITTWHGSPHTFPPTANNPLGEFDPMKVGTGEGAQAYGVGAGYLAEAKGLAEGYRNALSNYEQPFLQYGKKKIAGQDLSNVDLDALKYLEIGKRDAGQFPHNTVYYAKQAAKDRPEVLGRLDELGRDVKFGYEVNKGNLYKVDLPDEHVAKMLDWDKPLSEQPHILKSIEGSKFEPFKYNTKISGGDFANQVGVQYPQNAEQLKNLGITGIRYLDAASRDAVGKGTSNFVVFDPKHMNILERNGVGGAMIPRPKTEFEILHDTAQRNAALPVEQGGLGLPANNTYIDRANAPGMFPEDAVHFSRAGGDYTTLDSGKYAIAPFDAVGTHVGTPQAAMERFENTVGYKVNDPNYINDELKGASYPVRISNSKPLMNQNGMPFGEEDLNTLLRQAGGHNSPDISGGDRELNAKLRKKLFEDQGYTNIPYFNEVEGKGSVSQIVPPANIRSRYAAYDPFRRHEADILAGVGVGGMLDPQAIAEALRQQDRK